VFWLLALAVAQADDRCTYTATVWNTIARRTTRTLSVDKPRSELTPAETGPSGCTPCEQDQVSVRLDATLELTLCRHVLPAVMPAIAEALRAGARIESVLGYRPSISKGVANAAGERTELSLHAFGAALDVNTEHNGLYGQCIAWSPGCVLMKGGPWDPSHPLSLHPEHPLVQAMAKVGWGWGGELEGNQKDFMHFSPTGG